MNHSASKLVKKLAILSLLTTGISSGCTTNIDNDAFRAGAIEIKIDEVTSDEIYPSAGDEIDWKMVFVPTPGDIIVNTFWDDPAAVFNVSVGIYDRFGIPIKVEKRDTASGTGEVRAFTPESGLHYVKVMAESGRSIYSMNLKFETNYEGFTTLDEAPGYTAYVDFDAEREMNAKAKGAAGAPSGAGAGTSPAGAAPADNSALAAPAGAVVLPTAAAGGAVVLPTAAAGGIAASNGASGPTIVREAGSGGGYASAEPRTVNMKTSAVATEKESVKPIVADIKGRHKKIDAEILSVTSRKKGAQFKINVGKSNGVREGSVGEIYVDGQILEGGRFKVDKILDSSSIVVTNASAKDVKRASKVVVKVPE